MTCTKDLAAGLLALAVAACSTTPTPTPAPPATPTPTPAVTPSSTPSPTATPTPTPGGTLYDLPTVELMSPFVCSGIGLDGHLTGDPGDPRVVWVVQDGGRLDVVFAPGLRARFVPTLEIVDLAGAVVAREGDAVDGACVIDQPPHDLLVLLGFIHRPSPGSDGGS
jgi:hypothetical protein